MSCRVLVLSLLAAWHTQTIGQPTKGRLPFSCSKETVSGQSTTAPARRHPDMNGASSLGFRFALPRDVPAVAGPDRDC